MNTKTLSILITLGIAILVVLVIMMVVSGKNNPNNQSSTRDTITTVTPTPEVRFVVVRVLPSGFSPDEVTIETGMIVRFTNPLDSQVSLTWEGETQYTSEAVFAGNDIATTPFDTEGEYTFTGDATESGKIIVR